MRICCVCGKMGRMGKHHIIHGHGKRKACQTEESLIDICYHCHRLVHSKSSSYLDMNLKKQLQDTYFKKGYTEAEVSRLMGGRLIKDDPPVRSKSRGCRPGNECS